MCQFHLSIAQIFCGPFTRSDIHDRACHIHYIITAEGHEPFTTMMYFNHSPYVDSDTIFSVRDFRVDIVKHDKADEIAAKGLDKAFYTLEYTFILP
jgi:protocatechuate 3,4-dioxygenase beta subunit